MSEAYDDIMRGLTEVEKYLKGEHVPGLVVHIPGEMTVAERCEREGTNISLANFMIDGRVAKIMHAIYREEEKPNPDAAYLTALDASRKTVWNDRHAMQGDKPDIVEAMIAKYDRLKDAEPTVYE